MAAGRVFASTYAWAVNTGRRRDEKGLVRGLLRRGLLALVVVAVIAVGVIEAVRTGFGPLPDPDRCTVAVAGGDVSFDPEQSENAALMAAIAIRRNLPARAVSIALEAAMQESKLRNLKGGDLDSLGLFQQRPSQGWGTPEQILDPVYAIGRFYDALVKVDGYQTMPLADAAQAVQHSAYPSAYAKHEPVARALASALTGYTPGNFDCAMRGRSGLTPETAGANRLTPRAAAVRKDVRAAFGRGITPRFVRKGSTVQVAVSQAQDDPYRLGWAVAQFAVARADLLDIASVAYRGKIWKRNVGWRDRPGGTGSIDRVVITVVT